MPGSMNVKLEMLWVDGSTWTEQNGAYSKFVGVAVSDHWDKWSKVSICDTISFTDLWLQSQAWVWFAVRVG